jgi:pimeloyl-ACP methyl ester carboxylesterase
MGGLVASYVALKHQNWFNGLLLISPAVDVDKNLTLKFQSMLGGPLEALAPWARLIPAVKIEDMSECAEVCSARSGILASCTVYYFHGGCRSLIVHHRWY